MSEIYEDLMYDYYYNKIELGYYRVEDELTLVIFEY